MPLSIFPQASGDAGIRQTLAAMVRFSQIGATDPAIRDQAANAIGGCHPADKSCQCYAILAWVNRKMAYVRDPHGTEMLHDPRLVARAIASRKHVYGDCDDMSMYLAALLKSIGLAPTFRAVGYSGLPYQHVYVVCEGKKLDATRSAWVYPTTDRPETSVMERAV